MLKLPVATTDHESRSNPPPSADPGATGMDSTSSARSMASARSGARPVMVPVAARSEANFWRSASMSKTTEVGARFAGGAGGGGKMLGVTGVAGKTFGFMHVGSIGWIRFCR